jgi:hypothetical protein
VNRATLAHSTKPRKEKKPATPHISSDLKIDHNMLT